MIATPCKHRYNRDNPVHTGSTRQNCLQGTDGFFIGVVTSDSLTIVPPLADQHPVSTAPDSARVQMLERSPGRMHREPMAD